MVLFIISSSPITPIKLFFPNITLCDQGCFIKGVNLTSLKASCECTLNNLLNNNIFGNEKLFYKPCDL